MPNHGDRHTVIERVRNKREKLADVLRDEEYRGIRRIVEELYPDSAHFIFELLQNAEDTKATEASFELTSEGLSFEHNGRPFSEEDILGITNIGMGTKSDDADTIGRFGVGFKAVFAYTETPRIWSPTYSFQISELVLPSPLHDRTDLNGKTRFEFPFNNAKKPGKIAYAEVADALRSLSETSLLFLNNLESISWKIDGNDAGAVLRIAHTENHIEVRRETSGSTFTSSHFLRFTRPLADTAHKIAIAFALEFLPNVKILDADLPLAKQMRIVPVPGQVAVFFPAEKETSGLRFHLHAPFVPELSRASIKDTPANEPLFEQLADLAAAALFEIRDLGLLTSNFLSVLPNEQDRLPERYQTIRAAIINEMNNEDLTPTHDRRHAPARRLLQAKASLKKLLSVGDLQFLVEDADEPPLWAVGAAQKNSDVDRFLESLEIRDWGMDEFVELLSDRTSKNGGYIQQPPYWIDGPDKDFMKWLSSKSIEWHQQLYALLYRELEKEGGFNQFEDSNIIRLSSGDYCSGKDCFFPDEGNAGGDDFQRVDIRTYSSGKNKKQQKDARKFLEEIGVRTAGEAEQVEMVLKKRYTYEAEVPPKKIYKKDLNRFISFINNNPKESELFKDFYIFKCDDDQWRIPNEVYIDSPFMDTGLRGYYEALGDEAEEFALDSRFYQSIGISLKSIANFAKAVGAITKLRISKCSCRMNPEWSHLRQAGGQSFTFYGIDEDYQIIGLKKLLEKPTVDLSKLIWKTISDIHNFEIYSKATYRRNARYSARTADSSLIHVLRSAAWVPQGDSFVRPSEATPEKLPEGFLFDSGQQWLKAVQWGEAIAKQSEKQRRKEAAAHELGFSNLEAVERARRFAQIPPEEQERLLAAWDRAAQSELPDRSPTNPERRAARVSEMAADAPERHSEKRVRSVSVAREEIKAEAAQYLLQQYMNEDDELFCQICKKPMPFKLDDGSPYFEKVEFLSDLKKRYFQNYIALCPNHAAMFMHVNNTKDIMKDMFLDMTDNELEVVLAQENMTIYFTKTHIADLKKVIEVDDGNDAASDKDDKTS